MDADSQIRWIEERKRKLAAEIERLEQEFEKLVAAQDVIRLMERETPEAGGIVATEKQVNEADQPDEQTTKLGPPRPEGIPTNFEMVESILMSAEKDGKDGLLISEIISEIRARYWPGLNDVQVSAPIYSFVKKGRLRKLASGKFKRVRSVEG